MGEREGGQSGRRCRTGPLIEGNECRQSAGAGCRFQARWKIEENSNGGKSNSGKGIAVFRIRPTGQDRTKWGDQQSSRGEWIP